MTDLMRAAAQQALEALDKSLYMNDYCGLEVSKHDQPDVTDAIENLRAVLAEPEPCQYPDCVDNGPEGKCTRWLLAECSKSEDYKPKRPAEPVQEPDSPERRCGGPGCDLKCCQPVAQRGAMFHTHPAVERQRSVEAAVRPACGVDPAAKAETVQEPVAYSQGRTLHWHEGKGVNDAQLYLAPPKLDKGPVVAQISPNITSAIEEWKQLGGEIIRNEPPSAQLPPLPKNLHSLAGNIWCSICEWADAEPGAEASAAAKQINKALEEELLAYAKEALRLNGVNV